MPTYKSFEELDCWQKCRELRLWVNDLITKIGPHCDKDKIANIKRASRSTTRNIAEGFGRYHYKENIQFCRISRGSLFEIKDDLLFFIEEERADPHQIQKGLYLVREAIYSLNGYISYLNRSLKNV